MQNIGGNAMGKPEADFFSFFTLILHFFKQAHSSHANIRGGLGLAPALTPMLNFEESEVLTVRKLTSLMLAALVILAAWSAAAEDTFRRVSVTELKLKEGPLPSGEETWNAMAKDWRATQGLHPAAVLDDPGEIYLESQRTFGPDAYKTTYAPESYFLNIRAPQAGPLAGRLFWPDPANKRLRQFKFTTPAAQAGATSATRQAFLKAKESYYANLAQRNVAGAAWFRHQEAEARAELNPTSASRQQNMTAFTPGRPLRATDEDWQMERTYDLFSGGRAVSENLQLDRALNLTGENSATIDLKTLPGISTREMDWSKLTAGLTPKTDRLARLIPADQHAIFFPSFQAMTAVMDEAKHEGTPLLRLAESRSEDALTRERYERQLCLATDALSRIIGPKVVASVAFTGSDPYLRSGSDVAVIFEAVDPKVLGPLIAARQEMGRQANPAAKAVSGEISGVAWKGSCSPDRAVCSYMAIIDNAVVVTNSLYQLGRIVETTQGRTRALDKLGEYTFFRDRYKLGEGDETALLILSDPTIRRWCDARWRIGASRRLRAASVLSELLARNLGSLETGDKPQTERIPGAGDITWTANGPVSSIYGDLAFMTPIAELPLEKVTQAEANGYNWFRDRYQQHWRNYFDPIAIRLTVKADRLATDLTVMPLILGSEFHTFREFTQNAALAPGAGDPHPEAWLHVALAINKDAETFRQLGQTMTQMRGLASQGVPSPNPLGWLGSAVAAYADEDPYWKELQEAKNRDQFMERNLSRLPLGICIEVSDGLKLAFFLTTLRGLIEQTAPGMTRWTNETYKEHPFVRIAMTESMGRSNTATSESEKLSIYYASTPRALVISPNKALVQRALDRLTTASQGAKPGAESSWLGRQVALKVRRPGLEVFQNLAGESYQRAMQERAWSNLPILNEWHRLYPKESPTAFHERFWRTRLTSPGGGDYVWNEEFQTMESTVYGHPGAPKEGPRLPEALTQATAIGMGLSFENDGLRGQATIERESAKK